MIMLLPRLLIRAVISSSEPLPIDSITITAATPMMIPSIVRKVRRPFFISALKAVIMRLNMFILLYLVLEVQVILLAPR